MVGADVGGEDGVGLVADLDDALAGLDVPDDDLARLAAAAAAGEQQAAVAAELQDVGSSPRGTAGRRGGRSVSRVVEQDLLLPGDGDERGPRAGASATIAVGRALTTTGSVGRVPRASAAGPAGLPIAEGSSLNSTFGLALTATTLPAVSRAPASIHFLITSSSASGSFGAFGRHERLVLCASTWSQSELPSGSPGSTTSPEPPPSIALP